MNEAVLAGQHFHEGTKGHRVHDLAGVFLADFDLREHVLDHLLGALQRLLLRSVDVHGAVVLDVEVGARLGLNRFDVLSARPNKLTDAIRIDLHGLDAWSVFAQGTRIGDRCSHHFQHLRAGFLGNMHRLSENIEWKAGKLEVQLEAGNPFAGATEFEVHVAVEVLTTDDVEQGLVFLDRSVVVHLGHETNRDSTHWANQRHAGVQEAHGAGTNRRH